MHTLSTLHYRCSLRAIHHPLPQIPSPRSRHGRRGDDDMRRHRRLPLLPVPVAARTVGAHGRQAGSVVVAVTVAAAAAVGGGGGHPVLAQERTRSSCLLVGNCKKSFASMLNPSFLDATTPHSRR